MSERFHNVTTHREPIEAPVTANAHVPATTVEIRTYWPAGADVDVVLDRMARAFYEARAAVTAESMRAERLLRRNAEPAPPPPAG